MRSATNARGSRGGAERGDRHHWRHLGRFRARWGTRRGPALSRARRYARPKTGPRHLDLGARWRAAHAAACRTQSRRLDRGGMMMTYVEGELAAGNRIIDEAATVAGRDPRQGRRIFDFTGAFGPASRGYLQ